MGFFKIIGNGYILATGKGNCGTAINEQEYSAIMTAIQNKPVATATTDYRLKTDLTWEEYQVEPPAPSDDIDDSEALEILLGGAE